MTGAQFAELLSRSAYRSSIKATISTLAIGPAGRGPASDRLRASEWYRALSADDQTMVRWVAASAAHGGVFQVLAVIDGVVPSGVERFEIIAVTRDGERRLVNREDAEPLHGEFQALVMTERGELVIPDQTDARSAPFRFA